MNYNVEMEMIHRSSVSDDSIQLSFHELRAHMQVVLDKHGRGAFASTHEIIGVLIEEFRELEDALHSNDDVCFQAELKDIAQVCVFAFASFLDRFNFDGMKTQVSSEAWSSFIGDRVSKGNGA